MREIPLTKGMVALVDDEDFERVSQFKWCASISSRGTKWYALRRPASGCVRMHHFILGVTPSDLNGNVVDHLNHDGLDNQKSNLEIITQEENMRRSPGWKRKVEEPSL